MLKTTITITICIKNS